MANTLDGTALDLIFRSARTRNGWQDRPLSEQTLREIYDVVKFGPTSFNSSPARFVFVRSPEAKARLKPYLMGPNVDKTMAAPCCVIIAYDTVFHELFPQLFPVKDIRPMFTGNAEFANETAQRNSTLQGAYLIIAARAMGLDCGPMSGFDKAGVDAEFFPEGRWKSNFLCNIGYGTDENLFPRLPRLDFEQACQDL